MYELKNEEWVRFLDATFNVEGYHRDGTVALNETHTVQSAMESFGLADLVVCWLAYKNGSCRMLNADGNLNAVFTHIDHKGIIDV